jgi:hypothetical protein
MLGPIGCVQSMGHPQHSLSANNRTMLPFGLIYAWVYDECMGGM